MHYLQERHDMKRVIHFTFIFTILLSMVTWCSAKSWAHNTVDAFCNRMLTRHTYEYNSFEHMRDKALLCLLPTSTAQFVLAKQRSNMSKFLEENEKNALQGVKNYLNYNEKQWSQVMTTIKEESEFNLNAMRQPGNYNTLHDASLPPLWVTSLKKECVRHDFRPENISFEWINGDNKGIAATISFRPKWWIIFNTYYPGKIVLNSNNAKGITKEIIPHCATHEMLHMAKQHHIQRSIIKKEVMNSASPQIDFFKSTIAGENWEEAMEKTADLLVACVSPEAANNAIKMVHAKRGNEVYKKNYNDIQVIHANWQMSQTITDFGQLKSFPQQKLSALAHLLQNVIKS